MSVSGQDLLRLQFALQRIGVDANGDLIRLPGPHPDGLPRFYAARFVDGDEARYYRHDLPLAIRRQLHSLSWEQVRGDTATVCALLAQHGPCEGTWIGKSYTLARPIDPTLFAGVRQLDPAQPAERCLLEQFDAELTSYGWPAFAFLVEGHVAAACISSRETAAAAEAWVQTAPAYRRRGFARRVTAAWAHAIQTARKIPFYSHSEDNVASAGVARSVGFAPYVFDAGYL